jgi:hypothetical protein
MAAKTRRTPVSKTERDEAVHVAEPAAADVAANQAACAVSDAIAAGAGVDVVEEEDTQRASYWIDRLSHGLPACSCCPLDEPPSAPRK